jgi:hypothetical protein
MNFDKLIKKLRKENALDWKTAAIDELSEKIYESDKLNLVCELIQNANDSYANKVCFVVKSNEINLYHNGDPFNETDITQITRCAKSKKKAKPTEKIIGRFGIGFKSVFKYCNEPQIYSTLHGENFGFKLVQTFLPYKIPSSNHDKRKLGKTRFCLRIRKNLIEEFINFIENNANDLLLFLPNIKNISFIIENKKFTFRKKNIGDFVTLRSNKKNKTLNEKFLLFKHKIKTSKENNVIKLAFKVDANNKFIKDEHPNNLFTYFKLKVDTGLFFYFHAPFELDIGRTRPEDSEDNEYTKKECFNALTKCFEHFKKKKFLNSSFLEILPNSDDETPPSSYGNFLNEIRENIVKNFKKNDFWPCVNNQYTNAENAYLHNEITKFLYKAKDLCLDVNNEQAKWSIEVKKNSRSYKFVEDLNIDLAKYNASEALLQSKNNDWLIRYYSSLNEREKFSREILIKTNDDKFVATRKARFKKGVDVSGYNYVNESLLKKGGEKLEELLKRYGVKEVDSEDRVNAIIERYSNNDRVKIRNVEQYENDLGDILIHFRKLKKKIKLGKIYKEVLEDFISNFKCRSYPRKSHYIFADEKKLTFSDPEDLYVDHKEYPTDLDHIYNEKDILSYEKGKLYVPKGIHAKEFYQMASLCGVHENLEIEKTHVSYKRKREFDSKIRFANYVYRTSIDDDYIIKDLDVLLEKFDYRTSLIVCKTLSAKFKTEHLYLTYKPNASAETAERESTLIKNLKSHRWIPAKDKKSGCFASKITTRQIDKFFLKAAKKYRNEKDWLKLIGFEIGLDKMKKILIEQGASEKSADEFAIKFASQENKDEGLNKASNAMGTKSTEDATPKRHRKGPLHSFGSADEELELYPKHTKRYPSTNKSKIGKKITTDVRPMYKYHCQICLVKDEVNKLAPKGSYAHHDAHRSKIIENAHGIPDDGDTPDENRNDPGIILSLCSYHHRSEDGMGDKFQEKVLTAIQNSSNEAVRNGIKGCIVETDIDGHQSISSTHTEKIKIFFTKVHKNYWLKKYI